MDRTGGVPLKIEPQSEAADDAASWRPGISQDSRRFIRAEFPSYLCNLLHMTH
jgi:hypothetical protein